jgi:hypothetical protein
VFAAPRHPLSPQFRASRAVTSAVAALDMVISWTTYQ